MLDALVFVMIINDLIDEGFPADTHDVVFLTLHGKRPFDRCPNCGNVYKYNQVQVEEEEH